jgi:hypothetical protein
LTDSADGSDAFTLRLPDGRAHRNDAFDLARLTATARRNQAGGSRRVGVFAAVRLLDG